MTHLNNGAWIRALMASQKSVRGPHPQRLRLDEIDEMELAILEASQGQPMETTKPDPVTGRPITDIQTQTVMSSTHQYPDKTMSTMLKRARENGWPVFEWCYRESMGTDKAPGWLTAGAVERKRNEVSKSMWDTEYDLQEPSFEGRAIDMEKVKWCFNINLGEVDGDESVDYIFEEPDVHGVYCHGIDWAKEQDWTIIATFRADVVPWRCVAWRRTGRLPWPVMVGLAQDRINKYRGIVVHDNTGIGDVVHDMLSYDTNLLYGENFMGATRSSAITEYIKAIEAGEIQYPRIDFAFNEHKYVTMDDLFGRGHAPDSFVAGALAWSKRIEALSMLSAVSPASITREASPWRS
jgi:hypothetical protein